MNKAAELTHILETFCRRQRMGRKIRCLREWTEVFMVLLKYKKLIGPTLVIGVAERIIPNRRDGRHILMLLYHG